MIGLHASPSEKQFFCISPISLVLFSYEILLCILCAEGIQALASRLNATGARCHQAGLAFAYHDHDFEFANLDGRTWYDSPLEATDPELVKVEVDVYRAAHAGHDPLALLQRLGNRIARIHCKDQATDGAMTEVGQGTLDMPGMTAFAQQQGVRAVVEHDHPTLPSLESARLAGLFSE